MSGVTAFRGVSVGSSPYEYDIFDTMAGGSGYLETFAGGSLYSGFIIPQGNPKSILKQYAITQAASLVGLQEDYVKYALMPLQFEELLSDREIYVISLNISKIVEALVKGLGGRENSSFSINSGVLSSANLAALQAEFSKDSALEDMAESIAGGIFGPIGAALAGALVGGLIDGSFNIGENVAESVARSLSGIAVNQASAGIAGALGVTSVAGSMVIGALIGAAVTEAMEVALGLDRSFGFGGDFKGNDETGAPSFDRDMGFLEGLSRALGFDTSAIGQVGLDGSFNGMQSYSGQLSNITDGWASGALNTGFGSGSAYSNDMATGTTSWGGFKDAEAAFGLDGVDTDTDTNTSTGSSTSSSGGGGGYNGGSSYGGGRGDSNGNASGSGHGSDGTVICTALSKYGVFTKDELREQFKYTLKTHNRRTIDAYHLWAKYFVRKIEQRKQIGFWSYVMRHRANEVLHRIGNRDKPDHIGKICIFFVDGFSKLLSWCIK